VPDGERWFLETALALIDKAGDFVSDKMWHRVVQVVTNAPDLHAVAATKCLDRLKLGSAHEMFTKVAAYCLGEFGHAMSVTTHENSPAFYSELLLGSFKTASVDTRRVILTALAKIAMHAGADTQLRQNLGVLFRYVCCAFPKSRQTTVLSLTLVTVQTVTVVHTSSNTRPIHAQHAADALWFTKSDNTRFRSKSKYNSGAWSTS
jgi:hypothetical protein